MSDEQLDDHQESPNGSELPADMVAEFTDFTTKWRGAGPESQEDIKKELGDEMDALRLEPFTPDNIRKLTLTTAKLLLITKPEAFE